VPPPIPITQSGAVLDKKATHLLMVEGSGVELTLSKTSTDLAVLLSLWNN